MTFCAHLCQPSLPPATASLPSRPGSHACDRLGCSILGRAYPCPWHIKAPMREHEPRWRCFVDSPPSQTVDFHPTALALSVLITSLGRLHWEHGRHCSSTAASRTRCSQRQGQNAASRPVHTRGCRHHRHCKHENPERHPAPRPCPRRSPPAQSRVQPSTSALQTRWHCLTPWRAESVHDRSGGGHDAHTDTTRSHTLGHMQSCTTRLAMADRGTR